MKTQELYVPPVCEVTKVATETYFLASAFNQTAEIEVMEGFSDSELDW